MKVLGNGYMYITIEAMQLHMLHVHARADLAEKLNSKYFKFNLAMYGPRTRVAGRFGVRSASLLRAP